MCQVSPERLAYCEKVIARQMEFKKNPTPHAMKEMRSILKGYGTDFFTLLQDFSDGKIGDGAAREKFLQIAEKYHTEAHRLGQEVAEENVIHGLAKARGRQASLIEEEYFQNFLKALRDEEPVLITGGKMNEVPVAKRVQRFLPKCESSGGAGYTDALLAADPQTQFEWLLGMVDHCADCIILADFGPYYKGTVPHQPREGYTECLWNCKCTLQAVEKPAALDPAEFDLVVALGLGA